MIVRRDAVDGRLARRKQAGLGVMRLISLRRIRPQNGFDF